MTSIVHTDSDDEPIVHPRPIRRTKPTAALLQHSEKAALPSQTKAINKFRAAEAAKRALEVSAQPNPCLPHPQLFPCPMCLPHPQRLPRPTNICILMMPSSTSKTNLPTKTTTQPARMLVQTLSLIERNRRPCPPSWLMEMGCSLTLMSLF